MKKVSIVLAVLIGINICISCYLLLMEKSYTTKNNYKIELVGESIVKVELNENYKDEGAEYTLNNEVNDAKAEGNIDTTKMDKNIVRYYSDFTELSSYNLYRIIQINDNIPPVINLTGGDNVDIYLGQKYEDKGYTVIDNSNEKLDDNVTINGSVNTKKKGTYVLTYTVTDSSGNKAEKKRIVTVKEKKSTEKRVVTTVVAKEKDVTTTKKVDLNKNSNTITYMRFTSSGIQAKGYVKDGNGNYTVKLCKNNDCKKVSTISTGKNYNANINLTNYDNGTYKMILESDNNTYDILDELAEEERIVRTKLGDKLITVKYDNNKPSIQIENFKYEYDILIDVGHGGADSGAVNSYTTEKNMNLVQSLYEKKRFEEHGLKVLITRTADNYGLMMGSKNLPDIRRRAMAVGYYGVVSKIVYSNHHNSINDKKFSGYEIILTNQGAKNIYKNEYKIESEWRKIYPNLDNHLRIYGRNYDTDSLLSKESGQIYNIKNYYAMQRIPYDLYNIYTATYEGCYLSNLSDYNWYINNWKKLSEIKIKTYVESLGISYKG